MKRTAFRMLLLAGALALLAGGTATAGEDIALNPQDDQRTPRVDDRGNRSGGVELIFIRIPERPVTHRREIRLIGIRGVDLFLVWRFRTELKNLILGG